MASLRHVTACGRDSWQLRFYLDGKSKTLSCGRVDETLARVWKQHVEHLVAVFGKQPPCDKTTVWIASLPKADRKRLESTGLIDPVEAEQPVDDVTVGDYLESYFGSIEFEKDSTKTFYAHTRKRLAEFFAGRSIHSVRPQDAREFRSWLQKSSNKRDLDKDGNPRPLASNTVRRRIGVCKRVFGQACKDGLIEQNPFMDLESTVRSNKKRMHYIDLATFYKVLAKAPNARWRSLLVLARFGCLRMPSEVCRLRWSDIAWDAKRVTIQSPKTEHHEGRESRIIPLLPEIERELLKLLAEADDYAEFVFPAVRADSNLRTTLEKIIRRAGVRQWPKLWQNLRASGASDLARVHPAHVATAICGHTEEVARESYWMITDEDFDAVLQKSRDHTGDHIVTTDCPVEGPGVDSRSGKHKQQSARKSKEIKGLSPAVPSGEHRDPAAEIHRSGRCRTRTCDDTQGKNAEWTSRDHTGDHIAELRSRIHSRVATLSAAQLEQLLADLGEA